MLLFDKEKDGVRYAVWHVTETYEELATLMTDGHKILAQAKSQFKSESRIKEWVAVRVLLHSMLGSNGHIAYLSNGAPHLVGTHDEISISHTKGYVCIALSNKKKVGIDIERLSNKVERVKSHFIGEDEPCECSLVKMHLIWSAKEAIYKLLQINGLNFKKDIRVKDFTESSHGTFTTYHKEQAYETNYIVSPDYVMTLIAKSHTTS